MRRNNWKAKILALIGILVGILAGGAAAWAAWKYAGAQYVGLAFFTVMPLVAALFILILIRLLAEMMIKFSGEEKKEEKTV